MQGSSCFTLDLMSGNQSVNSCLIRELTSHLLPAHIAHLLVQPEDICDISKHIFCDFIMTAFGLVTMPKHACKITFTISGAEYSHVFTIIENSDDDFILLGMDFLSRKPYVLDLYDMALKIRPDSSPVPEPTPALNSWIHQNQFIRDEEGRRYLTPMGKYNEPPEEFQNQTWLPMKWPCSEEKKNDAQAGYRSCYDARCILCPELKLLPIPIGKIDNAEADLLGLEINPVIEESRSSNEETKPLLQKPKRKKSKSCFGKLFCC